MLGIIATDANVHPKLLKHVCIRPSTPPPLSCVPVFPTRSTVCYTSVSGRLTRKPEIT